MNDVNTSPLLVMLFFVLRCMVPLAIMLGVSYWLKRMGFIAEPPPPPPDDEEQDSPTNPSDGAYQHGKA